MQTRFKLGRATYTVNDGWCETTFDDGYRVQALPVMDAESVARARSIGYRGTDEEAVWAMTQEHDLLHSVLAEAQGYKYSRALRRAHRSLTMAQSATVAREEALVLCVQQLLNHARETGRLLASEPGKEGGD